MSRRISLSLLACLLFTSAPVLAHPGDDHGDGGEDAGSVIDVPDASVGSGGADRDNEEQEDRTGRVATSCMSSSDCNEGFACQQGRCNWVGTRQLEGGCLLGVQGALFLGGFAMLSRKRRR